MKKSLQKKFNVITWDFNTDKLSYYDILPYFRECLAKRKKDSKLKRLQKLIKENPEAAKHYIFPTTINEMKEVITSDSMYMFWSRCQYEVIIHGWPVKKNTHKLDVHEQIMANLDIIAEILFNEISK